MVLGSRFSSPAHGLNITQHQGWIFIEDIMVAVARLNEATNGRHGNSRPRYYLCIVLDKFTFFSSSNFRIVAIAELICSLSDFLRDWLKRNVLERILPISYISGFRIKIKNNFTLQNRKWYCRPGPVRAFLQFFCCFTKLFQRNSMLIRKNFQRPKAYEIHKRVHASIGIMALVITDIFGGKNPRPSHLASRALDRPVICAT